MKLSKYLADYIEYEQEKHPRHSGLLDLQEVIKEGIEAYMSTENNQMILINEDGKQATIKLEETEL